MQGQRLGTKQQGKTKMAVCRTQDVDDLRFPPSAFSVALDALGWVGEDRIE